MPQNIGQLMGPNSLDFSESPLVFGDAFHSVYSS